AEDSLRAERERLRHVTELADAAGRAIAALAPDEGDGATALVGGAERSLAAVAGLAPELEGAAAELRDAELRLNETALELRRFLDLLQAEPDRLEQVESELEGIADAKRRFRCESYAELLARADEARAELAALEEGADPLQAAAAAAAEAEDRAEKLAERPAKNRRAAAEPVAHAVGETLRRLAERAQVLTITHLPQIATVADRHFSVQKIPGDPTHTRIEQLDEDGRQDEVRRMLGGQEFLQTVR